ncbi:MAG TPA: endonuclease/exonuclease/phosphatase family protein [Roseomonas sp.]|jgi:endonuclease/exonuclease/phosphatase family metal-dependent hydrolase
MRIVTWNVQWGLGMDGRLDLPRIIAHARALADFDVLCLQEIADSLPDLKGSQGENQFALVADLLPGYRAIAGAALDIIDEAGATRRFGNMILSRLPVRQVLRHTLPWPGGGPHSMPRMLIEATILAPFGPLRIMTTHLEYFSAEHRRLQVEAIRAAHSLACDRAARPCEPGTAAYALQPSPRSAILTGDFNMAPSDPAKLRLSDPFEDGIPRLLDGWGICHGDKLHPHSFCITDQTYGEPHCCDYVFVTENLAPRVETVRYDVETRLSDHQPVVLTLNDSGKP